MDINSMFICLHKLHHNMCSKCFLHININADNTSLDNRWDDVNDVLVNNVQMFK